MKKERDYLLAKERILKLRKAINHHRYLYHVLDKQEISDAALDSLKKELFDLEENYPSLVTPDSPTQKVGGAPLDKFNKITHKAPQWSFNDAFGEEDFLQFDKRVKSFLRKSVIVVEDIDYACELKIDGFKIILNYVDGVLITAATRGDGKVGEDVTENVKTIDSIPLRLQRDIDVVVSGEVWLSKVEFDRINEERKEKGEELYANPRNVAAGTIRQLDSKVVAARKLDAFFYDVEISSENFPEHQTAELDYLKELGFKVNNNFQLCKNATEVIDYWKKWQKVAGRQDYLVDGVVVKVNRRDWQILLGYTGKAPRFAIALKFPAEQATTVVEDIIVQVGRTGVLTPVAILRPIKVAGSVVGRATLHNEDEVKRLDVRVGDTVVIQKAGDVIPDIVLVMKDLRNGNEKSFVFPQNCPVCGAGVNRVAHEAAYKCLNENCFAVVRRRLYYFVSKKAFNIDGLGPKILDLLLDNQLISNFYNIFDLTVDDLKDLPGLGEKSAQNLISAISQSKNISLPRFITSLSIPSVGEETAYDLAAHFLSVENLMNASQTELENIHGVGGVIAKSIFDWFREPVNAGLVSGLLKRVEVRRFEKEETSPLGGKTFVLTGTLAKLSRDEAGAIIKKLGGQVSGSVSAKTSFLVAGNNPGLKYEKAIQLGVSILDENQFLKMVKK